MFCTIKFVYYKSFCVRDDIGSYIRTVYHMVSHTPKRKAMGSNPVGDAIKCRSFQKVCIFLCSIKQSGLMKSPHQTALFLVVFFQNAYRSDNYFGSLFKVLDYLFGIAAGACHFHSLINSLPAHIYLSAVNVVQLDMANFSRLL